MTVVILFKLYFPFFETHFPHITVPTKRGKINFEPVTVINNYILGSEYYTKFSQ